MYDDRFNKSAATVYFTEGLVTVNTHLNYRGNTASVAARHLHIKDGNVHLVTVDSRVEGDYQRHVPLTQSTLFLTVDQAEALRNSLTRAIRTTRAAARA